jgi:hypothetical protein
VASKSCSAIEVDLARTWVEGGDDVREEDRDV